ncbi:MAG: hypothetical protein HUK20_01325 [Fibrobacter sp.]|nr:hypothetical protein [Fibrobacter sp.]
MNGTTPTVNFKHRVALLDITIKPIGIKRNIDRIGVEYIVDYGEGYTPTQKYVVEYNTSQTFQDTARVIIAVSPAVYSNFGNSSFGGIPQNSEIKVYFKTKSESSHEPTETNTYTKTITKAGGVSIEAGKYYALTFNNPRCNGVAYNPSTHWCDNGTIKVLSTCNNELFNPSTQWCNECPECNGGKIDDYLFDGRDGQKYKTVKIGNQTWMAENLKYEYKINGVDASWCYKNEEINNFDHCEEVGRYYLWSAAMDSAGIVALANKVPNSKIVDEETIEGFGCGNGVTCTPNIPHRGVCPEGWHVPTKEEYETLFNAAGGSNNAGNKLRSTTGIFWKILGTDDFGFSARAGGGFDYAQNKVSGTGMGSLWTASWNQDKDNPYAAAFSPSPKVSVGPKSQTYALTLRCLKDTDTGN